MDKQYTTFLSLVARQNGHTAKQLVPNPTLIVLKNITVKIFAFDEVISASIMAKWSFKAVGIWPYVVESGELARWRLKFDPWQRRPLYIWMHTLAL
jgi:hypothetical protein